MGIQRTEDARPSRRLRQGCWVLFLGCSGLACSGAGGPEPCPVLYFPTPPAASHSLLYVASGCPAETADGSREHPFPSIGPAVGRAVDRDVILIAGGTYRETLVLERSGLTLIGTAPDQPGGPTVLQAQQSYVALYVSGTAIRIEQLQVLDPTGIGLFVDRGVVAASRLVISAPRPTPAGLYGHGVLVAGGGRLLLEDSRVQDAAGLGVLLQQATGELRTNHVERNRQGGIRLEQSNGARLEGNTLTDNGQFGIGLFSSSAHLVDTRIEATQALEEGGAADGIVVAELRDETGQGQGPARLELAGEQTVIRGNARVGILFSANSSGQVRQGLVQDNRASGIWLQSGAGAAAPLEITGVTLRANRLLGIGITGGASATVTANVIRETVEGLVFDGVDGHPVGDGIGLFDGGHGLIRGNEVSDHPRAGILVDAPAASGLLQDNRILRNEHGLVLQHLPAGSPFRYEQEGNLLQGNRQGDLPELLGPDQTSFFLLPEVTAGFADRQMTRGLVSPGDGPPE